MMWLMRTSDVVPYDYDQRFSPEMTWARVKRYVPEEYEEEIRQKIAEVANHFALIEECRKRFQKR